MSTGYSLSAAAELWSLSQLLVSWTTETCRYVVSLTGLRRIRCPTNAAADGICAN
ncbi:hypothetical protein BFJ63_vAg10608 [Fusarium oxysporum f. sp. narcissi]|uniref:Uncharacterized protein n=1 Tax=Fusarium oxysporum f. sp. narcissi TaxID=451672 RepID=A0A4Q2VJI2_FUSOX|nr:hypothetical protein BFJ63_vAg10608 [Fusarium oxysporum f. sp. narcissi]